MKRQQALPVVLAATLILGMPFLAGSLMAQSTSAPSENRAEVPANDIYLPPPPLRLEWSGLSDDGSVLPLKGSTVELLAVHRGKTPLLASLHLLIDDGSTGRARHDLHPFKLRPGETRRIPIDLLSFGLKTTSMRFSGQILATARVQELEPSSEASAAGLLTAPLLYFHREPAGLFQTYGETALVETFRGGDLHGSVKAPKNTVLRRVRQAEERRGGLETGSDASSSQRYPEGAPGPRGPTGPTGPTDEASTERRLCIQWEIQTADHGRILLDQDGVAFSEDSWNGLPNPVSVGDTPDIQLEVIAHGVWIVLSQGDWNQALQTDPTSGCVNVEPPRDAPMDVHVATIHTDKNDNSLKVVAGDWGFPFIFSEFGVTPPLPSETITIRVGGYSPTATLAAVSGFAAYREHFGLSNKEIRILETTCGPGQGGNTSSAHIQPKSGFKFSKGRARITVHKGGSGPCDTLDHRRFKFIIAHEIGHAWMLLARGADVIEENVDTGLEDATEEICTPVDGGYTQNSLEWDSVGVREGMAHFYAARVFNKVGEDEALFTWQGSSNLQPPLVPGGRLWNQCSAAEKCFKGTNIDWARFWWNWHTPYQPGLAPKTTDLRNVYVRTQNNGGLLKNNYYHRSKDAMKEVIENPDWREAWVDDAVANGIGEGCSAFSYPDCECWGDRNKPLPQNCQGSIGCPCVDVTPLKFSEDLLTDASLTPDGLGSYLKNGSESPGQHCYDEKGRVVCGAVELLGKQHPVCQVCDLDTLFGCECQNDEDCQGLEEGVPLSCHGAPEYGWKGNSPGTCLPSTNDKDGREKLEEIPWFCLDNCGSKNLGFACLYDQMKNQPGEINLSHAQCVDVFGDAPAGFCESQPGGYFAPPEAKCPGKDEEDWIKCCQSECSGKEKWSCSDWGFPDSRICDFGVSDSNPGHCVPAECANEKTYSEMLTYCQIYW